MISRSRKVSSRIRPQNGQLGSVIKTSKGRPLPAVSRRGEKLVSKWTDPVSAGSSADGLSLLRSPRQRKNETKSAAVTVRRTIFLTVLAPVPVVGVFVRFIIGGNNVIFPPVQSNRLAMPQACGTGNNLSGQGWGNSLRSRPGSRPRGQGCPSNLFTGREKKMTRRVR